MFYCCKLVYECVFQGASKDLHYVGFFKIMAQGDLGWPRLMKVGHSLRGFQNSIGDLNSYGGSICSRFSMIRLILKVVTCTQSNPFLVPFSFCHPLFAIIRKVHVFFNQTTKFNMTLLNLVIYDFLLECFHGVVYTKKITIWQFSFQHIFYVPFKYLEKIL